MLTIQALRNGSFRDDIRWRMLVADLVRPKYECAAAFLDREFAHCDTLYLGTSETGEPLCAFMTAQEEIVAESGDLLPTVFLGLSVAHERVKNRGLVRHLYRQAIEEALAWERCHGTELLLWGTTASPTILLGLAHFLPETQPRYDGTFDVEAGLLANLLRRRLGATDASDGVHPFVLKGIATGTRYSDSELQRIEQVRRRRGVTLFSDLGVEERRNDRLLFMSRTRNCRVFRSDSTNTPAALVGS